MSRILQFSLLSKDEIREMAVAQISNLLDMQYEMGEGGYGKPKCLADGVNDPRLGPTFQGQICATCEGSLGTCVGHFGYIELADPVYHPSYLQDIANILNRVCSTCYRLFVNDRLVGYKQELVRLKGEGKNADDPMVIHYQEALEMMRKQLTKEGMDTAPNRLSHFPAGTICSGCGMYRRKYRIDRENYGITLLHSNQENATEEDLSDRRFAASDAYNILSGIRTKHLPRLGLLEDSHPENMIIHNLPVIPPCCRPSIYLNGRVCLQDMTVLYKEILKRSLKAKKAIERENPRQVIDELMNDLQKHIYALILNTGSNPIKRFDGVPYKSVALVLRGKQGLLRNNIEGKRVDFCARTVISPDASLGVDEIGVPDLFMKAMSTMEYVSNYNRAELQRAVDYIARRINPDRHLAREQLDIDMIYGEYRGRRVYAVQISESQPEYSITAFIRGAADVLKELKCGYIVRVSISDGSEEIFNRQPTLHRPSMMAHKVRWMPGKTIRLPLPIVNGYNADFDGDEGNIHGLQSYESFAEAKSLMTVSENLINPRTLNPICGAWQDSIVGPFVLCRDDIILTRDEVWQLVMYVDGGFKMQSSLSVGWMSQIPPTIYVRVGSTMLPYWTGKSVISALLPEEFDYVYEDPNPLLEELAFCSNIGEKSKLWAKLHDMIIINGGSICTGRLGKDQLGPNASKSIMKGLLAIQKNASQVIQFLNSIVWMSVYWIGMRGYTIGPKDIIATRSPEAADIWVYVRDKESAEIWFDPLDKEKPDIWVDAVEKEAADIWFEAVDKFHAESKLYTEATDNRTYPKISGLTPEETYDTKVNLILQTAGTNIGEIYRKNIRPGSQFEEMVRSGSKGSLNNLNSCCGCLGQQIIGGTRIPKEFSGRAFPHVSRSDYWPDMKDSQVRETLAARGWCLSSYLNGLTPLEFFTHAKAGREGIIHTAVKTSKVGYFMRQVVKGTESSIVAYDGSVRDSKQNVLQFIYGDDGFASERLYNEKMAFFKDDNVDSYLRHCIDYQHKCSTSPSNDTNCLDCLAIEEEVGVLSRDFEILSDLKLSAVDLSKYTPPINLTALLRVANRLHRAERDEDIISHADLSVARYMMLVSINSAFPLFSGRSPDLLLIYLRYGMSSIQIRQHYKLTLVGTNVVCQQIADIISRALVLPGEPVGVLAAQSTGEPTQQLNLNTFHYTGRQEMDIDSGFNRIESVCKLPKKEQRVHYRIILKPGFDSETMATKIATEMEQVLLGDLFDLRYVTYDNKLGADARADTPEESAAVKLHYTLMDPEEHYFYRKKDPDHDKENCKCFWRYQFTASEKLAEKRRVMTPAQLEEFLTGYFPSGLLHEAIADGTVSVRSLRLRFHSLLTTNKYGNVIAKEEEEEGSHGKPVINELKLAIDRTLNALLNIPIRGIPGVKHLAALPYPDPKSKSYCLITTDGSIESFIRFQSPYIDYDKITSSSIREMNSVFGIECARIHHLNECAHVYSDYGLKVNYRHIEILSDHLTTNGYLTPFTYSGRQRNSESPLLLASFERAYQVFSKAALMKQEDNGVTLSASLVMNTDNCVGCNYQNTVIVNQSMLREAIPIVEENYQFPVPDLPPISNTANRTRGRARINRSPNNSSINYNGEPTRRRRLGSASEYVSSFSPMSPVTGQFSPINSPATSPASTPIRTRSIASPSYTGSTVDSGPARSDTVNLQQSSSIWSTVPEIPGLRSISPSYSPTSPMRRLHYDPNPNQSIGSFGFHSIASPSYSPTSPRYSPSSPVYNPTLNSRHPGSPTYNPTSPQYSPTSPSYNQTSPQYNPMSPAFTQNALPNPVPFGYSLLTIPYNPTSPSYSPVIHNTSTATTTSIHDGFFDTNLNSNVADRLQQLFAEIRPREDSNQPNTAAKK